MDTKRQHQPRRSAQALREAGRPSAPQAPCGPPLLRARHSSPAGTWKPRSRGGAPGARSLQPDYLAELCFAQMRHHLKTLNPSKDYPRKWRQGDLGLPQSTARPCGPCRPRETSHPVHKRRRRGPPLVAPPSSARGRERWTDQQQPAGWPPTFSVSLHRRWAAPRHTPGPEPWN